MPSNASTVHLHLARWPAVLVVVGSNPRELAPREAALLAWLAIEGPTPRARLAALLWPDSDAEAAADESSIEPTSH